MTPPDHLDEERRTEEMSVATTAPAVPEAREQVRHSGPVRASGPVGAVADILRRRGLDPARAGQTEDRPDDTNEYQREVNRLAWANSLSLSGHGDYARYGMASLDDAQYPQHMRKYVEQLAAARTHNRKQLRLPEEQRRIVRPNIQHLIAHGTVGSGKTVAAAAAGAYAVEAGLMARFVSHSMYLAWLRPDSAPAGLTPTQVRERYERCDLLILDDLCNEMDEYATNHVRTHTSNLVTARLNSGRATLFTTNLNFDQVAAILGDRLASRVGNRATVLRMVGDDRRKPQRW